MTPTRAVAWGSSGHRIIAAIAFRHLNPRARQEVQKLLGKDDFVAISTYADEVHPKRPETTRWHYVEFPRDATAYVPSRDCIETALGDCTVAAIQRFVGVLRTEKAGPEEKVEALKFLVHLVGDLHQPLHSGYEDDAGGNTIRVLFFAKNTNLHSVWDFSMIARAESAESAESKRVDPRSAAGEAEYIDSLENMYQKLALEIEARARNSKSSPEEWVADWAFESYCLAVRNAYNLSLNPKVSGPCAPLGGAQTKPTATKAPSQRVSQKSKPIATRPVNISGNYYKVNLPVMEQQLKKAGVRLAEILNNIYPEGQR